MYLISRYGRAFWAKIYRADIQRWQQMLHLGCSQKNISRLPCFTAVEYDEAFTVLKMHEGWTCFYQYAWSVNLGKGKWHIPRIMTIVLRLPRGQWQWVHHRTWWSIYTLPFHQLWYGAWMFWWCDVVDGACADQALSISYCLRPRVRVLLALGQVQMAVTYRNCTSYSLTPFNECSKYQSLSSPRAVGGVGMNWW